MYLEDRREAGGSVDRMIYLDRSSGGCRREDAVGRILPIGVTTVTESLYVLVSQRLTTPRSLWESIIILASAIYSVPIYDIPYSQQSFL